MGMGTTRGNHCRGVLTIPLTVVLEERGDLAEAARIRKHVLLSVHQTSFGERDPFRA